MNRPERRALWHRAASSGLTPQRFLSDAAGRVGLADLATGTALAAPAATFRGRSVLISCQRQLPAALAVLALDGIARRMLLCPPDLDPVHLPALIAAAEIDVIVSDGTGPALTPGTAVIACGDRLAPSAPDGDRDAETEWLLLTSGTTGPPKVVVHTLASLAGPNDDGLTLTREAVWSTFYDIRRYGGLQILLRALLGGGSLVLSQAGETVADFLARAGACGITHLLGTPSHWRRALMSTAAGCIAPGYIRLSGEVADQAILNSLAAAYPQARIITHAFASTEAGVVFEVRDGLAGFSRALIGQGGPEIRIENGTLRVRSARTAFRYLGAYRPLADAEGFVDTGDIVELRGDRYYFVGRREGVINIGGQKVHPEEVEAVINRHPDVLMARVRGRRSPITGALVVADIVVRPSAAGSFPALSEQILDACRRALPAHKVPAMLYQLPALEIAGSGKLVRPLA